MATDSFQEAERIMKLHIIEAETKIADAALELKKEQVRNTLKDFKDDGQLFCFEARITRILNKNFPDCVETDAKATEAAWLKAVKAADKKAEAWRKAAKAAWRKAIKAIEAAEAEAEEKELRRNEESVVD